MTTKSKEMVERVMFYAMILIMLLLLIPSLRCNALGGVLLVLAFLYAVGMWWLLLRKGVWGFFQPFLIGWFGSVVPALWSVRVVFDIKMPAVLMIIGLVFCAATWIVSAWSRKKVENPLPLQFISLRLGLFMLFGALYFVW